MKNILVTGSAGFIGFHICKELLENYKEYSIIGVDNLNDYYDVNLKISRSNILEKYENFISIKGDITDQNFYDNLFEKYEIEYVVHLAAFAGVRHSFTDPYAYLNNNVLGTTRLFENFKKKKVKHIVFASSSSVYGDIKHFPFSTEQKTDTPVSLYAASKKSTELVAHSYAYNFNMHLTGLRFFTVYGPWGRPDMALFLFTKAILENIPIKVFNYGNMQRDFTYIDDIVNGTIEILFNKKSGYVPFKAYNIGSGNPISLDYFIELIEKNLNKRARRELLPIPPGDISKTYCDVSDIEKEFNYKANYSVEEGIKNFIAWYKEYYKQNKI